MDSSSSSKDLKTHALLHFSMETITVRAVIEVLGKPKEHVEESLRGYLDKIKADERYTVTESEVAAIKKQDDSEMWMNFGELEFTTDKLENVTTFCFDYMPSIIEVIKPTDIAFNNSDLTHFLNDLQARLHQVDMVAKEVSMQNKQLQQNTASLLKNYIQILLSKKGLTLLQLSQLTGVKEQTIGDYLDRLIDSKKVDLDGEVYSLVKKE